MGEKGERDSNQASLGGGERSKRDRRCQFRTGTAYERKEKVEGSQKNA